jgi:hypothetical protein
MIDRADSRFVRSDPSGTRPRSSMTSGPPPVLVAERAGCPGPFLRRPPQQRSTPGHVSAIELNASRSAWIAEAHPDVLFAARPMQLRRNAYHETLVRALLPRAFRRHTIGGAASVIVYQSRTAADRRQG